MTIKKAQRLNKSEIDQLEKLLGQLRGLHVEVSALSKKSPNDGVNEFKLRLVNGILLASNSFLGDSYRPFSDFEVFDLDKVPSNSDVTFVITQYIEAAERFRSDNVVLRNGFWQYNLPEGEEVIRTVSPLRMKSRD